MHVSPEYQDIVDDAIENKKDIFIPNCDIDHAIFLIERLIKRTKNDGKINIFSGSLHGNIYENEKILSAIDDAKTRNVSFKILLEDISKEGKELCKKHKLEPHKLTKPSDYPDYKFSHFLISDNIAVRIEKPHDKDAFKNNKIEADVNFNNKKLAGLLSNLFENTLFRNSEKIEI